MSVAKKQRGRTGQKRTPSSTDAVRAQLAKVLSWGDAHVTFDAAVDGIPEKIRGVRPPGFPYSAWELVEHLRLAQADILEFCVASRYHEKKWPDEYWPTSPAPRGGEWRNSIAAYRRDRRAFERLASDPRIDVLAVVPNGSTQTYLREILLAADHAAYHIGQLLAVRRALGCWNR